MAGNPPLTSSSKGRKKTALLARIRQQLEFYFGDANLNKDRFLQERLKGSEDGFIPLSVLMTFNKLRTLTTDESIVREAIKGSSLLILSVDALNVKRAVPVQESGPVDEKTLYVENLPEHADVDWVRGKFSAFGPVQYVSLPRFKSLKIKGFAFVEFDEIEAVERAVQYFTPTTSDPADVYEKEAALPVVSSVTVLDFEEDELSAKHGHKRKRDDVTMEEESSPSLQLTDPESSSTTPLENFKKPTPITTEKERKERRTAVCPEMLPLKVMPKMNWLALRKRYLDMQKASYRALKQKLKILSVGDDPSDANGDAMDAEELESDEEDEMERSSRRPPKIIPLPSKPLLQFQSGVILHLKLSKPVEDKKKTIGDLRAIGHVLFVDVISETDVFVRCDGATVAAEVTAALSTRDAGGVVRLLEGEEEKTYWGKILADMEKRSMASHSRRGKEKVRGSAGGGTTDVTAKSENKADQTTKNTHIKFK